MPIGKGAVFVPSMTNPDNEPVYGILSDGDIIEESSTGKRITLVPGIYTVVYGTGTADQMMQKKVQVVEGATTLVKPDWSGLVIDVINESRTKVREYYELLDQNTGLSYGISQGVEQGLDEQLRTWILPPGQYKVVKPGGNITDVVNFGTIRLSPGELVHAILVIDSGTLNFLGFGYLTDVRQRFQRDKKWTVRSELAGNALLNRVEPSGESGEDSNWGFTSTVQWLTDARYESGSHVIPVWSNLEEGLSMESGKTLRKYIDKAEFKLTYIYRLTNLLSPYVRVAAESRLFKTSQNFDDPTDYNKIMASGDTVQVTGAKKIELAGAFSPIYFKQGFGINSILIKTLPLNLNLRSGYGARQTYARDAYTYDNNKKLLSPIQEADVTGVEFLLLGDIRLGRYILFDTEFDILMPNSNADKWVFDSENRLRINLTSNVSLLLTAEFWRYENMEITHKRYQTLLRFSKFL
ncbi:MAG: hypothetical protein JXB48_08425 [Candidatus Latescibacteria bacterium]|nr:hypothetical protein [Candidatus Latescibacterota bacterium]